MGGLNKRSHIIEVGQEVIWSKGYDRCSVKDITTAAGLPKGSFYHYFESKEKFALEAMNEYITSFSERLADSHPDLSTLEKMIDDRIDSIVKINYARECYMSVMTHAYSDQEEGFRKEILAAIDTSNQAMYALLKSLQKQRLIAEELDVEELMEFVDFAWRGARMKARLSVSDKPLYIFKNYLLQLISKG